MERDNVLSLPFTRGRRHIEEALEVKGYTLSDVSMAQLGARQNWLVIAFDSSGEERPVVRLVGTSEEILARIGLLSDPA